MQRGRLLETSSFVQFVKPGNQKVNIFMMVKDLIRVPALYDIGFLGFHEDGFGGRVFKGWFGSVLQDDRIGFSGYGLLSLDLVSGFSGRSDVYGFRV
jgi:hypothetical protein